jgi:hypothetical protein
MNRLIAWSAIAACGAVLSCSETTVPGPPPPLTLGEFTLEQVDGAILPVQLTMDGGSCSITESTIRLYVDTTFWWSADCASPPTPPQNLAGFGATGRFHQVAVDSFVLPAPPPSQFVTIPPFAAGKKAGNALTVRTFGSASMGTHVWSFRREAP